MRPTLYSFWKFGKVLKGIGDQFVKKDTFWRRHTSLIPYQRGERNSRADVRIFYIHSESSQCITKILHLQILRVGTYCAV